MTKEQIIGYAVMMGCTWLCALVLVGIGIFAERQTKPSKMRAKSDYETEGIVDHVGFNKEVGRLWKLYSIPFWICGVLWFVSSKLTCILILVAALPGYLVLKFCYFRIAKRYRVEEGKTEAAKTEE